MARRLPLHTVLRLISLVIGVLVFVLLYQTRILDSGFTAFQALLGWSNEEPSPGARLRFSATAYCKGRTTATGVAPRTGVAAADPAVLPGGSVVNVATDDPKYNGIYTVLDTGPEVQGRELDLYMWSCNEALRFGRKSIQLTVLRLGWDPQNSSPGLIDRLFRSREARRAVARPDPPAADRQPSVEEVPALDAPPAEATVQPPVPAAGSGEPDGATGVGEAAAPLPPPN